MCLSTVQGQERVGLSSRRQEKYSHTSGSKSFARKAYEKVSCLKKFNA